MPAKSVAACEGECACIFRSRLLRKRYARQQAACGTILFRNKKDAFYLGSV